MNRHTDALLASMMVYSFAFAKHAEVFDRILAHPEGSLREMSREEMATLDAAADAADALDDALSAWVAQGALDGFEGFEELVPHASAWVATERDWRVTDEQREAAFQRLVAAARDAALKVVAVN